MPRLSSSPTDGTALRRGAERRLRQQRGQMLPQRAVVDPRRLLQELQVHQIELQMQNAALQDARDRMETLLEKYTDLYDFAPVAYFSLDERGEILEVNLTGAVLLGVERFRLLHRNLHRFVAPASRPGYQTFLAKVFAEAGKQVCEVSLLNEQGRAFWANLQAMPTIALGGAPRSCRLAVLDITALKRADAAQHRVAALAASNSELKREIVRREVVEESLRKSEQHHAHLLRQSRHQQAQLRSLSHRILQAQEEERKRISRELHDQVVQTLVGINLHLGTLVEGAAPKLPEFKRRIVRAQRLIKDSVDVVHRFARDLRPTVLDDLGLIPALHSHVREFTHRTKARVQFTAAAAVEELNIARRTVLYRVTQSALANVAEHAHATVVKVAIQKLKHTVRLEIHDNGRAFDVAKVLFAKRHKRLGLVGMRERVEMVGGKFSVTSKPGAGTTICADIPFGRNGRGSKTQGDR